MQIYAQHMEAIFCALSRFNVRVDRPGKQGVDPRSLWCIEECNALDMDLYEWSLRLFDEKLRECGIGPSDLMVQTVSN